jgi:hypothetical protein
MGKFDLAAAALVRARDAQGGQSASPDPHWTQLLAKAHLSGGKARETLAILEPHLEEWAERLGAAMYASGAGDPPEVQVLTQTAPASSAEFTLGTWVPDAWNDASMAHLQLGQLDQV